MYVTEFDYNINDGSFRSMKQALPQGRRLSTFLSDKCYYCQLSGGALLTCSSHEARPHVANPGSSTFHPLCQEVHATKEAPVGRFRFLPSVPLGNQRKTLAQNTNAANVENVTHTVRICLCEAHGTDATATTFSNLKVGIVQDLRKMAYCSTSSALLASTGAAPSLPIQPLAKQLQQQQQQQQAEAANAMLLAAYQDRITQLEAEVAQRDQRVQQLEQVAVQMQALEQQNLQLQHVCAQLQGELTTHAQSIQRYAAAYQQSQQNVAYLTQYMQAASAHATTS
jgi:hypothetical protein